LVTAPVHKSVINAAGIPFTGHTEFLAEETGAPTPVMMLAAGNLRVALATTHLPLAEVPTQISRERLEQVLTVLDRELRERFRIGAPRIAVLGLNPHAGESGVLGHEERDIIEPTVQLLTDRGLSLLGPVPADTAFTPEALSRCDAVLAMYHDQGLPVIKALAFGKIVNITLGLPIIRTSVDHGTALDLAGTGEARPGSLREAIRVACELAATTND
jgi:4-hydroxythreonine-4-phosphate dehydrogenase